jgi:hypothetical protein
LDDQFFVHHLICAPYPPGTWECQTIDLGCFGDPLLLFATESPGARSFDNKENLDPNISLVWPPILIIPPVFYLLQQVLSITIICLAILQGALLAL